MAQFLANELLILAFKELLNLTSFKYMNSICIVCKRWKILIELVLTEEIEFRLKSKLLIGKKYCFNNCSKKSIKYDFSNSSCNILINGNNFELYYPYFFNILENIEKRKISVHFKYENREEYLVEFNLGTLLFYEERNSNEMMEVKYSIEWNYKDCTCISKKDSQYDYFGIIIKIEKLIISLKKMCVILDLLDEKLNTKDYQYKYIIKRPTFDIDDFVCDFSHFTLEL
ncbi:hypothetical protein RhiirA5_500115 [Rhizophagus irregularis]|uniref:F-box domain-containing protein n=1 Tax=Rhizophagus irregularis TaxID=588596 RepID=A0A2N0PN45_9GLOM|nr:hypothetical protein RhiirA5_500115 [Rhizophagus irregularis]CAB4486367.1 unnamed protein product [Rhizophagus irregularis]CAB5120766.1 unnamed protein product [Rhizophagus irregularis]CAB5372783.1 unnamed protein product [Rhizophagus irregularis]